MDDPLSSHRHVFNSWSLFPSGGGVSDLATHFANVPKNKIRTAGAMDKISKASRPVRLPSQQTAHAFTGGSTSVPIHAKGVAQIVYFKYQQQKTRFQIEYFRP